MTLIIAVMSAGLAALTVLFKVVVSISKTVQKYKKMLNLPNVSTFVKYCGEDSDHGVGSTDHFSALKIWMFENKFVFLPSHLKTIEPMARPIREKSGTGFYHVMLRGINRQDISPESS